MPRSSTAMPTADVQCLRQEEPAAPAPAEPEQTLGQYRLLNELGRGGFGRVYRAIHTLMDRVVAVKVLAPEISSDDRARERFRREVRAVTRLQHPNIVMAHDADEADGVLFLVMEYVDGCDLDTLVDRDGPLPAAVACEMMRQCALALQHAHENGIVHRDVKPANILLHNPKSHSPNPKADEPQPCSAGTGAVPVSDFGFRISDLTPKVTDFGLARLRETGPVATQLSQGEKSFLGSPDYVSPEQAHDARNADARSDLYSLGCTFYFALTGCRPFRGTTVYEILVKHLQDEPTLLTELRPDIPCDLAAIVHRLMAKKPADRFASAGELAGALAPLCLDGMLSPPVVTDRNWAEPGASITCVVAHLAIPEPSDAVEQPAPESAVIEDDRTAEEVELPRLDARFWKCWREWKSVVEFCSRDGDPRRVDEAAYRKRHQALLAVCKAGAGHEDYRRLEDLLEPWVTPQALATIGPAALRDLLDACADVERDLGAPRGYGLLSWLVGLLVFVLATEVTWVLARPIAWADLPDSLPRAIRVLVEPRILTGLGIAALIALLALWRLCRASRTR